MPSTVNGIGTHYYGKKNCEQREAECRFCRRTVVLKSYDTRLWFVVLFVPVIPLGRKRIVDFCPACTRHYAVEADKWETAKQLNISGALENFRANPTAEAAIEAHQQMTAYHQTAQAAEFLVTMAEKFPDNAKVQCYLGFTLANVGKQEDAANFFKRALELRPDLPDARVGLAGVYMRTGRLDDARALLDFLEKPGAVQLYSLEPIEDLANAFQKSQRHAEALQLYTRLLAEIPGAAQHKGFRARVEVSEKALGRSRTESMLPKAKFNWRDFLGGRVGQPASGPGLRFSRGGLILIGAALVILAAALAFSNNYIQRHRKLYLVSSLNEPVLVTVTGQAPIKIRSGMTEVVLPEGRYHASISGAVKQEIDFNMHAGFFDRFIDHPAWILNPGGSSLFMVRRAVYSHNPQPASTSFHFGQSFYSLPDITHPFQQLPESVYLKRTEEKTCTQVELFRDEPAGVFYYFQNDRRTEEALRLAEWRLQQHPEDELMMEAYVQESLQTKQTARAQRFFKLGLTNRPVQIEWHRAYQNLARSAPSGQLANEYEALLAADPNNSSLLYLRGRACSTNSEALTWFERARTADASNPYPHFALGYQHVAQGDWAGARPLLSQACTLRPKDDSFQYWLSLTRLALGEFSTLEEELRARLRRNPLDLHTALELDEVLEAAGKSGEAEKIVRDFDRALLARRDQSSQELSKAFHRARLYVSGDFTALERYAATDKSPAGRFALFQAFVEQGRLAEAERIRPNDTYPLDSGYQDLVMSLACRQSGNSIKAEVWLQRALKEFDAGDHAALRAAALLRSPQPPSPAALDALNVAPKSKAILAAALAAQFPPQASAFASTARKLNVDRSYPYHLVQRVTAPAQ